MNIVVTGANGAIGKAIVRHLAASGESVIPTCRTAAKCEALRREILEEFPHASVTPVALDLSDAESVAAAAAEIGRLGVKGLINNAGVMCRHYTVGEGGVETTILVNYRNTRLLTELLLPHMPPGSAVVFTTSITRKAPEGEALPENVTEREFGQLKTYALSKKLLTRYAAGLAAKGTGYRVNCADPGVVDSGMIKMHRWFDPIADLIFRPFIRRPATGAKAAVRAFSSPDSGYIYTPHRRSRLKV